MKTSLEVSLSEYRDSMRKQFIVFCRSTFSSDYFHKVAETFATRILIIGIGLITSVIVARILGPDGRGLYAVAGVIGAIGVQFGNMGLHASNTYAVARNRELLPALTANTLFVSFIFGGLIITIVWPIFSFWPEFAPVHGPLLILGLLWIPFGLAYLLLQNLLLGIQDVRTYNKIELISNILSVILIGLLILVRLITVEAVFSVGLIMLAVNIVWALLRLYPHFASSLKPSFTLFRTNIIYGLKAYLAAFFAYLVLRVDMLMVQYILGAEQTGYYSIAVAMADLIYMLPVVVGTILFPKLSAMPSNHDKWRFTKNVSIWVGLIMIIVTGIASLLAEPIVRILYGQAFVPSSQAFIWLMPGILFLGVQVIAMQFLASMGFPKTIVLIWTGCFFFNIAMNLWAIPHYGIVGASVVSSLTYFKVFVLTFLLVRQELYTSVA